MKAQIEETRNFKIEISMTEVRRLLLEAGYEIPHDARLWMLDCYGSADNKLMATWDRKKK